jgi:hypothetical protein
VAKAIDAASEIVVRIDPSQPAFCRKTKAPVDGGNWTELRAGRASALLQLLKTAKTA